MPSRSCSPAWRYMSYPCVGASSRWLVVLFHRVSHTWSVNVGQSYAYLIETRDLMASNSPWHHLYTTKQWKAMAEAQKAREPLCRYCVEQGIIPPGGAYAADHVQPHRGDPDLFFTGELMSLCRTHHNATKQREEKRGHKIGCSIDGTPLGDSHWRD